VLTLLVRISPALGSCLWPDQIQSNRLLGKRP
jgi:hypothetical protein